MNFLSIYDVKIHTQNSQVLCKVNNTKF
jgi:hypothetical protein